MNVYLERLIVLADNKAVAYAGKIGAQRREVNIRLVLAYYINSIEGIGYLVCSEHVKGAVLVCGGTCLDSRRRCAHLAAQICKHCTENYDIALAAGIDDTRLLQDGVLVDGVLKRFLADLERGIEHILDIRTFFCILNSGSRCHTRNGKDRALGGLHDRLVSRFNTVLHGGGKLLCADGLHALESARDTAEQERQDNAGVSSCAAQQSACHAVGDGIDRIKFFFSELGRGLVHRKTHIRARIAVGHGENVKLVYLLGVFCKRGIGAEDHVLEHRGI